MYHTLFCTSHSHSCVAENLILSECENVRLGLQYEGMTFAFA
jgi:hypothetical protein